MYPSVFADFAKFQREFGDVSALPTPAFFYGLKPGEEISVSIEEGKVLFIKLINVGAPDKEGRRVISYELNGMPREAVVRRQIDRAENEGAREGRCGRPAATRRADPRDGDRASSATVGGKVAKGDKLVTLEAMKMQTTIYAHAGRRDRGSARRSRRLRGSRRPAREAARVAGIRRPTCRPESHKAGTVRLSS